MSMSIASSANTPLTTGEIANQLGQPFHKVVYAIKSRRIQPTQRAGRFRLYGAPEVEKIGAAIREMKVRSAPLDVNA